VSEAGGLLGLAGGRQAGSEVDSSDGFPRRRPVPARGAAVLDQGGLGMCNRLRGTTEPEALGGRVGGDRVRGELGGVLAEAVRRPRGQAVVALPGGAEGGSEAVVVTEAG
jgi:hypothetical protein